MHNKSSLELLLLIFSNTRRKSGKKGALLRKPRLVVLGSGDRKRQKEALLAKAQISFSEDYGTARGINLQVDSRKF